MKIMDPAHAGDGQDGLRDLPGPEVRRRTLQDDPDGIAEEPRRARGDERDDEQGDGRIEEDHAGERDDDGSHDDARGSEGVPISVEERSADVDVPPGRTT